MRQITVREKTFLSVGALIAVVMFVYFVLWPMLQGNSSGEMSDLEEMQERLEVMERLEGMEPLLTNLEERMKSQSGREKLSFKRGTADSVVIKFLADTAANAGIKEIEQLDAKPDTSRRTQTDPIGNPDIVKAVVDQLYLSQVMDEAERKTNPDDDDAAEDKPSIGPP